MEPSAVLDRQLDDILGRLTRPDDAVAALDEEHAPACLPNRVEDIERLPPEIRASSLYHHLREVRATSTEPRPRLARIAHLAPLITETVAALMAQPVAASNRRLAISLPIALLKCRYDITRQAVAQSVRQPIPDLPLATDCILATFDALLDLLVCYWLQHLSPPERFWGELHALYLLANHVLDSRTDGARQHRTEVSLAIRNAYLKPLLLGSLNPTRFNTGEIKQLVGFVTRHAPLARLGAAKGLFRIDPMCNRPPSYAVRNAANNTSISLCTRDLVKLVSSDGANLTHRLKMDLHRYWSSEQVRSEPHQHTNEHVEIVFGLEAAHQLLTGCVDDDDFLGHLGSRDSGQRVIAKPPIELHSAICVDRSPSGARLQLTGTPAALHPGELVALLLAGEPQCRLGIVRWTQLTPKLDSVAGLQWLPDCVRPCGTAAVGNAHAITPYFRTFLIPVESAHDSWELIAPTGILKPGCQVHLISHQDDVNLFIKAVVDMTFHVSRFHTSGE
jgi:hypothetical protein